MTNQYIISIIVPVYNAGKYIQKCLDSILTQTYTFWEAILVDDGSTDNSGDICDEYANRHKNITVIHKKNEGVSVARNCGIDNANGEWIVFIDSDDFVSNEYISSLYNATRHGAMPFGMTGVRKISSDGETLYAPASSRKYTTSRYGCIELLFDYSNGYWGYICGKIYNKKTLYDNNIRFRKNIHFNEDRLFCLEYLSSLRNDELVGIDTNAYYNYVIHNNAATSRKLTYKNLSELDAYVIMDKIVKEKIESAFLSAKIRCKCLDSLEELKRQYKVLNINDECITKKLSEIYRYCTNIKDLFPPYHGMYSKRLIKAYFKRP